MREHLVAAMGEWRAGCAMPAGDGRYDSEASYLGAGLCWELAPEAMEAFERL